VELSTSDGAARAAISWPAGPAGSRTGRRRPAPPFLLVLTHGSGRAPDSADLLAVRDAALPLGGVVALVTQPYVVKGRRAPGAADRQDAAWLDIIAALRAAARPVRLIQGGRSNGARVACRTARAAGARGVLALAFPLHPPGHPERTRAGELDAAGTDVLVINGSRDAFGIPEPGERRRVVVLPAETHALTRNPAAVGAAAGAWLREMLG
jgi:uncharacterized protein